MSGLSDAWKKLEAFAVAEVKAVEQGVENLVNDFAPILEADLEAFINSFGSLAAQLVLSAAQTGVSSTEKNGNVVAGLIQAAETAGTQFTSSLHVMAQTVAQQAYAEVAKAVTAAGK